MEEFSDVPIKNKNERKEEIASFEDLNLQSTSKKTMNFEAELFQQQELYTTNLNAYQGALQERDEYISALKSKIEELLQQKSESEADINTLKDQFLEITNSLGETGIQYNEFVNLKQKLNVLHQEIEEMRLKNENILQQSKIKSEELNHLENKYKLLVQTHKKSKEEHLRKITEFNDLIESNNDDFSKKWQHLLKEHDDKLREAEALHRKQTDRELSNLKKSIDEEIQNYKSQLSEIELKLEKQTKDSSKNEKILNQEISDLKLEQQKLLEENVSMSSVIEQSSAELYELKAAHSKEMANIAEQIDIFESNNKNDAAKLDALHESNLALQKAIQIEQAKNTEISLSLNESQTNIVLLQSSYKEIDEQRNRMIAENDKLTKECLKLKAQLIEEQNNREADQRLVKLLESQMRDEKESKNQLNLSLQKLQSSHNDIDKQLQDSLALKTSLESEVMALNQQLESVNEELQNNRSELKVNQESLTKIENRSSCLKEEFKKYKSQCHSVFTKLENIFGILSIGPSSHTQEDIEPIISSLESVEVEVLSLQNKIKSFTSDSEVMKSDECSIENRRSEYIDKNMLLSKPPTTLDSCQQTDSCSMLQIDQSIENRKVMTSQTIEEDYSMEEIFVVPKKCSAILPPVSHSDFDSLNTQNIDNLFVIKSLENENNKLKSALQQRNSNSTNCQTTDRGSETEDNDHEKYTFNIALINSEIANLSTILNHIMDTGTPHNSLNEHLLSESRKRLEWLRLQGEKNTCVTTSVLKDSCIGLLRRQLSIQICLSEILSNELKDGISSRKATETNPESSDSLMDGLRRILDPNKCDTEKYSVLQSLLDQWNRISCDTKHESFDNVDISSLKLIEDHLVQMLKEQKSRSKVICDLSNHLTSLMDKVDARASPEFDSSSTVPRDDYLMDEFNLHESQATVLKEFQEVTSAIVSEAETEKIKLLENQKSYLLQILKENSDKISQLYIDQIEKLNDSSDKSDPEIFIKKFVTSLNETLSDEVIMIENQYGDLVKQYTHEQSLLSQTTSLTLLELGQNIASLFNKTNNQQCMFESKKQSEDVFQSLEAPSHQSPNAHLQKRVMNTLIQVTLNLLHFYSVCQNYTDKTTDRVNDSVSMDGYMEDSPLIVNKENMLAPHVLDTTGASEGMLEDLDNDEMVKRVLANGFPNLISILKGNFEDISLILLDKEVQELIISLQAAAGMMKIYLLPTRHQDPFNEKNSFDRNSVPDLTQHPISFLTDSPSFCPETIRDYTKDSSLHPLSFSDAMSHGYTSLEENAMSPVDPKIVSADYTMLKPTNMSPEEHLAVILNKLTETVDEKEMLQKKLHQTNGLLMGLKDVKMKTDQENLALKEDLHKINDELVATKEVLMAKTKELHDNVSTTPTKKLSPREIKDRVRAVLAAKDKERLNPNELLKRNRELEELLEEVVREKEEYTERLLVEIAELKQQLKFADNQLRSLRNYSEEQALERDQEFESMVKKNEVLTAQIKERHVATAQRDNLEKEVVSLQREFRDKESKLMSTKQELQERLLVSVEKVKDLQRDVQSLETDLSKKCSEFDKANNKLQSLQFEHNKEIRTNQELTMEVENLRRRLTTQVVNPLSKIDEPEDNNSLAVGVSSPTILRTLSEELEDKAAEDLTNYRFDNDMFQMIDEMLERSVQNLESLQISNFSGSVTSEEDLSVREQLEMSRDFNRLECRALSPSSIKSKLEEKAKIFEKRVEGIVKYVRDLEMRNRVMKTDLDEGVQERDDLFTKLSSLSNMKMNLEKASQEYAKINLQFDRTISELKDQLDETKQKLMAVQIDRNNIQKQHSNLQDQFKIINQENENRKENLSQKCAQLKELEAERNHLQRQNSEQLLKISSMEGRLEDFKRAESPLEDELKQRINTLQEELQQKREELSHSYRENKDLTYSIQELREKLVLREEELDKLSREYENDMQPSSLPQSNVDQRVTQIQDLRREVASKSESINYLKDKLAFSNQCGSKMVLSENLMEKYLEQKNLEIEQLKDQLGCRSKAIEDITLLYHKGKSIDHLLNKLNEKVDIKIWETSIRDITPNSVEVQRDCEKSLETLNLPVSWNGKTLLSMPSANESISTASCISNLTIEPTKVHSAVNSPTTQQVSSEDCFLPNEDEYGLLKAQISILQQEIRDLTEYQKKLEDDFKASQQMLEAKEEELEIITTEMDDSVGLDLAQIHSYREQINSLASRVEFLEEELDLKLKDNDLWKQEVNSLRESIEVMKGKEIKMKDSMNKFGRMEKEFKASQEAESRLKEELLLTKQNLNEAIDKQDAIIKQRLKEISLLEKDLDERDVLIKFQKSTLQKKDIEVAELTEQVDSLTTQFKDRARQLDRKISDLETDHQNVLEEMRQKNIEREKHLCNVYEERMASEVMDLSIRKGREKEETLKQMKNHYESLISSLKEKDEGPCQLTKQTSNGGSMEDLQKQLRHELDNAAQLNNSLLGYLEADSQVGSESSNTDSDSVGRKIMKLMNKVHKEGVQVLSLTEFVFLQNHSDQLSVSQRSVLSDVDMSDIRSQSSSTVDESVDTSSLEREFSDKEANWKRKERALEFSIKMEKVLNKDWKCKLEAKTQLVDQLTEELQKRQNVNYDTELSRVNKTILETKVQTLQFENEDLKAQIDAKDSNIIELERSLNVERMNFSRVSTTLNHQRKLAEATAEQQSKTMNDLRENLEAERKKTFNLMEQLHDFKIRRESPLSSLTAFNQSSTSLYSDNGQETETLRKKLVEGQCTIETLKDRLSSEKSKFHIELSEKQTRIYQLQRTIFSIEDEIGNLQQKIKVKDDRIKILENDLQTALKSKALLNQELKVLSSIELNKNLKMDIPIKENQTMERNTQLKELRRHLTKIENDLKFSKEREQQLCQDLEERKAWIDQLGQPSSNRIKILNEKLELLQKENIELCKSLSRFSDDRRNMRQKISTLEEYVEVLHRESMERNLVPKNVNRKEAAEKETLQMAYSEIQAQNRVLAKSLEDLTRQCSSAIQDGPSSCAHPKEQARLQYFFWKIKKGESHRKSLVWQKTYLLSVLEGFQRTETNALNRLQLLGQKSGQNVVWSAPTSKTSPLSRFRSVAIVIISLHRMKSIVKRWAISKRIEIMTKTTVSSAATVQLPATTAPETNNQVAANFHITGLTPPTKDKCSYQVNRALYQ